MGYQDKTKEELLAEISHLHKEINLITANYEKQVQLNSISEAKIAELEDKHGYERNLLNIFMNNTPDHVYFKDKESRFIRSSKAQAQRFGFDNASDVIGKTDFDFFSDEHAMQAFQDEQYILNTGEAIVSIVEKETWTDGTISWVSTTKVPLLDGEGQVIGTFGISRDISDQKLAEEALKVSEEQLRKSEKRLMELNGTKDKFFSIISHDLKGVFSIILGLTECMELKAKNNSTDNFEKLSIALNTTARNAHSLLENLLYWAKVQTGQLDFNPDYISIEADLENITDLYSSGINEKRIDFSVSIQSDLVVFADSFMIQTVLRNLISNAIKYTSVDGKIIVEIKQEEDFVQFNISDTGVGIPKEDIENLFRIETSFSTHGTNNESGSGLGLILCKEFIEKHNGKIWVESEEGKGSTFSFLIPVL